MHALEIVTVIGLLILAGNLLARWLRLPPPLVLLTCGAVVGFLPGVGEVQMPPDVVLFLFHPRPGPTARATAAADGFRARLPTGDGTARP